MNRTLKVLGILSVLFGTCAALICLYPKGIFFALLAGFAGMICSTAYIYIIFRYPDSNQKFSPGIIGILLSSVPVLIILIANFSRH